MPLSARSRATVVPLRAAMELSVSPERILWLDRPLER